jgi:hypothetical protein
MPNCIFKQFQAEIPIVLPLNGSAKLAGAGWPFGPV